MYKIKRGSICFFLVGILFSCQKDPIIGDWKIEKDLINEGNEAFSKCSQKTVNSFTSDSIFIFDNYVLDDLGNCQSLGKVTGFWKKKNDSVYVLNRGKYNDTIRLRFIKKDKLILKNNFEEDVFELKRVK